MDLSVAFEGELGVGPGPTREFFELVARDMTDPSHGVWEPSPDAQFMTLSPHTAADAIEVPAWMPADGSSSAAGTSGGEASGMVPNPALAAYELPTERSLFGTARGLWGPLRKERARRSF